MVGVPSGAERGACALLTALILGSASTLEDDVERALALFEPGIVIGCNHGGRDWPGELDHFCTMHPDLFPHWLAERRKNRFPEPGRLWHARHRPVPDGMTSTPVESWGGSSGLLCVAVAFELGCERIVLAGVPMVKAAGHFDDLRPWNEARTYQMSWERRKPQMLGRVKSMSGWTRDLLGCPEEGWLADAAGRTAGAA